MKNNKIKEKNAITLVALVITVILLLILAGITLSALSKNGLFEKTMIAKEKYEDAEQREENTLNEYKKDLDNEGILYGSRDTQTKSIELTEEHLTGETFNGKPVYEKVWDKATMGNWNADNVLVSLSELQIDEVLSFSAYYAGRNGLRYMVPYNVGQYDWIRLRISDDNKSMIERHGNDADNGKQLSSVTIRYTKTTD